MLIHRINSRRIDMSHHLDTLSQCRTNQSLHVLFNAACLAKSNKSTIYRTLGEHANHYATDAVVITRHFHYYYIYIPSIWFVLGFFVWWCLTPLSTIFQLYFYIILLEEETGGPGENHWPVASHWQTLSHNVVHLDLIEIRTHNISGDRHWLHRKL